MIVESLGTYLNVQAFINELKTHGISSSITTNGVVVLDLSDEPDENPESLYAIVVSVAEKYGATVSPGESTAEMHHVIYRDGRTSATDDSGHGGADDETEAPQP